MKTTSCHVISAMCFLVNTLLVGHIATSQEHADADVLAWPFDTLVAAPLYAYSWNLAVPGNETLDFSSYPYMHFWAVIRQQTLLNRTPEQMLAHMESMPEGHRVMFIFLLDRWMTDCTNHNHDNPPHPAYHCPEVPGMHDATMFIDSLKLCGYDSDTVWISTLWWENGVHWMKGLMDNFFAAYKAAGGKLDALILDTEKSMLGCISFPRLLQQRVTMHC